MIRARLSCVSQSNSMTRKGLSARGVALQREIARDPASRAFVPLADEYLKHDLPDEAVRVLSDGLVHHPTHVAARGLLAQAYLQKRQVENAQAEFLKILSINPDNVPAHKKLIALYRDQGDRDAALASCASVLRIDPSDKETKALLSVLQRECEAGGAVPDAASVPQDEDGIVSETLAELYVRHGHYEKAAVTYQRLLIQYPGRPDLRQGLEAALSKMEAGGASAQGRSAQKVVHLKTWLSRIQEDRAHPPPLFQRRSEGNKHD